MTAVLSDVAMIQHACKRGFLSSFLFSRIHHQELSSEFSTRNHCAKTQVSYEPANCGMELQEHTQAKNQDKKTHNVTAGRGKEMTPVELATFRVRNP